MTEPRWWSSVSCPACAGRDALRGRTCPVASARVLKASGSEALEMTEPRWWSSISSPPSGQALINCLNRLGMSDPTPPLPSELPVLPLRQTVAFPLTLQPLAVNRPVSLETVNRSLGSDRLILLVLQDNEVEDPGPDDVRRVGTVAIIRQMAKTA